MTPFIHGGGLNYSPPQVKQPICNMRLFMFKDLRCIWIGRVEDKTIRQDKCHRMNGVIRVFDYPAAHPTGIVRENAAHHAGIDRGWIGPNPTTERFEYIVDKSADDARLKTNQISSILH